MRSLRTRRGRSWTSRQLSAPAWTLPTRCVDARFSCAFIQYYQFCEYRESISGQFHGKRNWYNLFLERGIQLLRPGGRGRLGIIAQDALLHNDNSTGVRQLLAQRCRIDLVVEVAKRNAMFPDVHKGAVVVVASKVADASTDASVDEGGAMRY